MILKYSYQTFQVSDTNLMFYPLCNQVPLSLYKKKVALTILGQCECLIFSKDHEESTVLFVVHVFGLWLDVLIFLFITYQVLAL